MTGSGRPGEWAAAHGRSSDFPSLKKGVLSDHCSSLRESGVGAIGPPFTKMLCCREQLIDPVASMLRAFAAAFLLSTLGLGVACAASAQFDEFSIERSGCFGSCPSYTVKVTADGTATYEGEEWVKEFGKRRKRLGPAQMAQIRQAIAEIDFFNLRDSYASRRDGCAMVATDSALVVLVVKARDVTKTVNHYHGCAAADGRGPYPRRLTDFEDRIDRIIGTREWIGLEHERTQFGKR
jgi:hypothetical protein